MPAATVLNATLIFSGTGTLSYALDLSTVRDSVQTGSSNFDALSTSLAFGTGNQQAKEWFHDTRTITAGANDDIDLAGGLTNPFGTTLNFAVIKAIIIIIDAHDGTLSLRVGPQGVANAWQGWQGGVAAGNYDTVMEWLVHVNSYAGWAVTAGTADILRINNPGAGSVTYHLWLIGTV